MRFASAFIGLALLSACAPSSPPGGETAVLPVAERVSRASTLTLAPASAAAPLARNRAACTQLGGLYEPAGRAGYLHCVLTYSDAGKSCSDGADCEGDCLAGSEQPAGTAGPAVSGTCQATTSRFGCYSRIEQGRVAMAICVD